MIDCWHIARYGSFYTELQAMRRFHLVTLLQVPTFPALQPSFVKFNLLNWPRIFKHCPYTDSSPYLSHAVFEHKIIWHYIEGAASSLISNHRTVCPHVKSLNKG